MSAAGRLTPWNLVFGDDRFDRELFPALEAESETDGGTSFDAFLMLRSAARVLHALESGGMGADQPAGGPPSEDAARSYGRLVWQAWHFWRNGSRLFAFDEPATRDLLEDDRFEGGRALTPPAVAGYVQLARNLIWARVDPAAHAEPLDGFFWLVEAADASAPAPRLHLQLVFGLRSDRAGISVIDITAPLDEADHWAVAGARADGPDFGNILPGGDLDRLHGMLSTAEALKLAARAFVALAARTSGEGD